MYLKVSFFLNGQQNNLGSEKNMTPLINSNINYIITINSVQIRIQSNEGWNGQNSNIGRVPSTAAVFPHWIATAALCVRK